MWTQASSRVRASAEISVRASRLKVHRACGLSHPYLTGFYFHRGSHSHSTEAAEPLSRGRPAPGFQGKDLQSRPPSSSPRVLNAAAVPAADLTSTEGMKVSRISSGRVERLRIKFAPVLKSVRSEF
jgi:hypothetical protein